jgi:lysozyme
VNRTTLKVLLVKHEGKRNKPYLDCCGKPWRECSCTSKGNLTIGVGRNLDAEGLSDDEVTLLLDNDVNATWKKASTALASFGFNALDDGRQHALLDLVFNLGIGGVLKFARMLAAIGARDWSTAAAELKNSRAYKQEPARLDEDARLLTEGV